MSNRNNLFSIFSFSLELKIIFLTITLFLFLPVFLIFLLTNTGIEKVSDILLKNTQNKTLTIYDPKSKKYINFKNKSFIWPLRGNITLNFGESDLPYQVLHTGIDIGGITGSKIQSVDNGVVIHTDSLKWGYGKHVIIQNDDSITTLFAHLNSINVKKGDIVQKGDIIGTVGSTGWSTGPHLHFEIRLYNIPINPIDLLQN